MLYITLFIIIFLAYNNFSSFFLNPLRLDSFVSYMNNGVIPRTPLLQHGQTIATLPHGLHRVTGGYVSVGLLPTGNVTKIIGIVVDQFPTTLNGWNYHHGNLPFNMNFAKVLYELHAAGKRTCSYTSLDYAYSGRDLVQANLNSQYLQAFKASRGLGANSENYGEFGITSKILNALAEQEN